MEYLVNFGFFVFLLMLGLFVGGMNERRHFRNLAVREAATAYMLITQTKSFAYKDPNGPTPQMLVGETVIATDYLKSYFAKWRNLFGGEVRSYSSLLERARREALMRVVEQARQLGYNAVCNVRFETADVGGNSTARRAATVAIIATGTAYQAQTT